MRIASLEDLTLSESRLSKTWMPLAFSTKPDSSWDVEDNVVLMHNYRRVSSNVLVVETSDDSGLVPVGSCVMIDGHRSREWVRYAESRGRQDQAVAFANVFRDGLLSLHRGLQKMGAGAAQRLLVNNQTMRELRTALMESYTLDVRDEAAVAIYTAKLLKIAARFESSDPTSIKAEINYYLQTITVEDVIGRTNIERWPLMFMRLRTLLENLHAHLTEWQEATGEAEQAVSNLREGALNDAGSYLVIAEQARLSRALLQDEGLVDNKDNAVLAWPRYCEALEAAYMRPFAGWFQRAARHWRMAIAELEKSDMGGLSSARREIGLAAACLRVPAIMDEIDVVTQSFSWNKSFPDHRLDHDTRESMALTLHQACNELGPVMNNLPEEHSGPELDTRVELGNVLTLTMLLERVISGDRPLDVTLTYDMLVDTNRHLMVAPGL